MSDEPKSVADLFSVLRKTPLSGLSRKRVELRSLPKEAKKAKVLQMQMAGIPIPNIATTFEVTPQTIRIWLSKCASEYRQTFEQETGANILAESLQWLENIEQICLYEIDQTSESEIDPDTGEVIVKKMNYSKGIRHKFVLAAMKARAMKIDLLLQTGVLPKEPERIYHTMANEKIEDAEAMSAEESGKSKEDLIREVMQLLEKGRSL